MDLFPTYIHRFEIYDNDLVTQIIQHIKKQQEVSEAQKLEGSCNNVSGQYSVRGHGSFHSKDDLAQLDTEWSKKLRALLYQVSCDLYKMAEIAPAREFSMNGVVCARSSV